jgi:hypothetical protein
MMSRTLFTVVSVLLVLSTASCTLAQLQQAATATNDDDVSVVRIRFQSPPMEENPMAEPASLFGRLFENLGAMPTMQRRASSMMPSFSSFLSPRMQHQSSLFENDQDTMPFSLFSSSFELPSPIMGLLDALEDDEPRQLGFQSILNDIEQQQRHQQQQLLQGEDEDESPVIIRIRVFSDEEENQPRKQQEEPNLDAIFSTVFNRMRSLIDDMGARAQQLNTVSDFADKHMSRRECPMMRACGDDVHKFCADEHASHIKHAVGKCLFKNKESLSSQCLKMMESRFAAHEQQEKEQQQEKQQEQQPAAADSQTETSAEAVPQKQQDKASCAEDVVRLCSKADRHSHERGLIGVMACLSRQEDKVSKQCLEAVTETPAYSCASDALQFCPRAHGRHSIVRCLAEHSSSLSKQCLVALKKAGTPAKSGKRVTADNYRFADEQFAADSEASAHSADKSFYHSRVLPIAIGAAAFVMIASLVAIIVYRRRRRTQRHTIKPIAIRLSDVNAVEEERVEEATA